MTLHLAEISAAVAPGAHTILLLDQAGWHGSIALIVPATMTLLPLPAKCPNSIRSRMSDSSCATTGCRTASANPTPTSSTNATSPEPSCRSTMAHHAHRPAPLGTWVMVSESWYKDQKFETEQLRAAEQPQADHSMQPSLDIEGPRPSRRRQQSLRHKGSCPSSLARHAHLPILDGRRSSG